MHPQSTPIQLPLFPAEKRCSGPCGRLLPPEAFGRHKKARDGRQWWCRSCMHDYHQAHRAEHNAQQGARKKALRLGRRLERTALPPVVITHKTCCACDELKPLGDFQRTRRTKDGHQSWCKACRAAYDAAHTAAKAVYDAGYRAANPERRRNWGRLWRARNAERVRASRQRHAAANCARVMRAYRANPEPFKVRAKERRVRLRRIPGSFTAADIALIRETQRGLCAYCGSTLMANSPIEHMTPITRGGTNWPWNLCIACRPCNQRKFTKTAGEYLALLLKDHRGQAAV